VESDGAGDSMESQVRFAHLLTQLKRLGSILVVCAIGAFFVFSSLVGIYGLVTDQGDDFYNKSPWGMIAFPGYFFWVPLPFLAGYELLKLGWRLVVRLGSGSTVRTSDLRLAWTRDSAAAQIVFPPQVLEVAAWTTGVVGILLFFWGSRFLPAGIWFLPTVALLILATGVLLLRGWTSWHSYPRGLGRVTRGVAAGVLIAIAFAHATQTTHRECIDGVGGRDPECFEYAEFDGPDMGGAALALLGAGALVYFAAGLKDAQR
jgi:hypothetical protein